VGVAVTVIVAVTSLLIALLRFLQARDALRIARDADGEVEIEQSPRRTYIKFRTKPSEPRSIPRKSKPPAQSAPADDAQDHPQTPSKAQRGW
jgi:hypothetical protein